MPKKSTHIVYISALGKRDSFYPAYFDLRSHLAENDEEEYNQPLFPQQG